MPVYRVTFYVYSRAADVTVEVEAYDTYDAERKAREQYPHLNHVDASFRSATSPVFVL